VRAGCGQPLRRSRVSSHTVRALRCGRWERKQKLLLDRERELMKVLVCTSPVLPTSSPLTTLRWCVAGLPRLGRRQERVPHDAHAAPRCQPH
jgi:hypothetical protein